jgi:hypothetical protein
MVVTSCGIVRWGQKASVLSMSVIGMIVLFRVLFARKRATLREPDSEERDSNGLTTKS